MFRTTLTVLFAALTLSVPAFAQKGATGQDATQTKPIAELKETESTYEEVPVVIGGGGTRPQSEAGGNDIPRHEASLILGFSEGLIRADIHHTESKFFGGVLLSLSSDTVELGWLGYHILQDAVVMGFGFGVDGHLALEVPAASDLAGIEFFGQAVLLDSNGIRVGSVERAVAE